VRAAEVIQCYVEPVAPRLARPPRELRAFEKVWLDPGETQTAVLDLDERALACWDPGDTAFEKLSMGGSPVPAGGGRERRDKPGWAVDSGRYRVHLGTSSRDLRHTVEVAVEAEG
jgi:beta-glucosidase